MQCLSIINMILSDEDKILIKSLYLKGYTAKRGSVYLNTGSVYCGRLSTPLVSTAREHGCQNQITPVLTGRVLRK